MLPLVIASARAKAAGIFANIRRLRDGKRIGCSLKN
jgi:hypothetical protein